jgi:PAS domain S-box-containing protein
MSRKNKPITPDISLPDARVSDQLSELHRRAEEILLKRQGELDKIPPADMQNAFHELRVHQIELEMQKEELRRVQQELESSREKYFNLYDLAPVGYVSLNDKGIILEANLSLATLLGRERSHLVGQPLSRFIHREDQDLYYICHKQLVEMRAPQVCEIRMGRKDGTLFWVRIDIVAADGSDGTKGSRAIIIDIRQRKQNEEDIKNLNRRLKQHVAQLELANEELEAFSSSVSHDLRAPLRHMSGFADLLQKQLKNRLYEKSLEYSDLISQSAKKMERLIDDLLSYSGLGRKEIRKREVNLSHLLKESVSQILTQTEGRDIVWKIDKLPNVYGEPSMLKLVLINLIANAVKFTSTRTKAEIEIGCRKDGNEDICFIKDNGVGFNMDYADKLFGVFQRLHTREEFEGTGIGLANVRRIVSLHGGRTWAEGTVNQGATFYFSIPRAKELID